MSHNLSFPTSGNLYQFPALNTGVLYINGKKFEDYINELVFEDQLEQSEIDEIKLLLQYLNTSGLSSEWIVDNNNKNQDLKTAITALQTKLAQIDTTALTESSVLTNDNRNSVLKTDLTALTARVTTAEGDIDSLETRETASETNITAIKDKTDYIIVTNGDPANAATTHGVFIGNKLSVPVDATKAAKKVATLSVGRNGQGFAVEYDPSITTPSALGDGNRIAMQNTFGGHAIVSANYTRIQGGTEVNIGEVGLGVAGYETINIGGKMATINIGSVEDPDLGTTPGDPATGKSTKITIGKKATLKNTWTYLAGNFYTNDARWENLPRTDKFTFAQLLAFIPTTGIPLWVVSFALTSSIPNFEYSDVLVLKDGGTEQNKTGEMTTSNNLKTSGLVIFNRDLNIAQLTPIEGTFVARGTISKTTLDGSVRNSVFLDGGGNNKICLKHHNIAATDITEWATTEANSKVNVVEIGGNSGILIHQGASNAETDLKLVNTKGGNIVLKCGATNGILGDAKDSFTVLHDANYPGAAVGRLSPQAFATDETARTNNPIARLEIDCVANRKGIRLFGYDPAQPFTLAPDETTLTNQQIITPTATATSLVINGNYTGNTDARLYKNADNKLMWNGAEVGAGGVSSGGITYMINVASNISNPDPTPTETIMTAAYSGNAQRTITQAVSANTAYYIAKYTTEVFDEVSNPVLTGLQQLNQYILWNSQNQVGQLYGQLWFQATAIGFGVLYQRTYASPVTTTPATVLNGTPIPTPKGLYTIKFQRVVFPNINVVVSSGTVVLRYRVQGLVSGSWTNLYTMVGFVPPTVSSTTNNLTITLDESVILSQTTPGATALRLVLFIDSGTGTISQTSAGGADLAAYSLIGLGVNTPGLFRTMLYDGTNAKITIPYSTTPTLIEYDLAIDAPYNVSAFASPTLSTDLYFIQPAGGFANHAITLYFNEGSISHYHSTISPTQTTLTLAQVLNSGATASQDINMNSHKISGITTLEGSSNGNWNVKEITAAQGSGISVTPTNGSYAIANAGIISITSGAGISVSTTNGAAVITNTNVGATQVGVAQQLRDEHQSLYEVGALPRKPAYWATNWSVADSTARSHLDMYVSVDGKIIVSATGNYTIRYSTDYGTTWNNATGLSIATTWTSICGTSNGSRLFAFGTFQAQDLTYSLVLYTSLNQGASWTQITSSAFSGLVKVNRVRCSGDGTYLLASDNTAIEDGRILYSTNGGTTWARQAPGDLPLGRIEGAAVSRSGAIQFLTWINNADNSSRILRSVDYGFTWSEVSGHITGGNWTRIETDATGRFVFATRYLNINTPQVETYRSDNYGINWNPVAINGIEDIWVSGTGQFVAGVSNPQGGGISYVVYSTDYGRSFTGVDMTATTGSGTTYRTINGSADGSILVLGSVNFSESVFNGDGLLRIARSGTENIYDLVQAHNVLWYTTNIKSSSAVNNAVFPINTTYGNINFDTHNIEYEIEINWDRHTSVSPSVHIRMGFNGIESEGNIHSANTTWVLRLEHATVTIHAANQGAIGYDQHYNNRFYCGYSALQGTGDQYRYRTLLTGQLGVQRRKQAQTVDLGSYSADWSLDARTLTNRFTSDSYILENTSFSASGPDRSKLFSQTDFDNGHHCVSGTAIWELTDAGAWESGYGGAYTALKDGIKNINISFINNTTIAGINRSFDISARFWRVRK